MTEGKHGLAWHGSPSLKETEKNGTNNLADKVAAPPFSPASKNQTVRPRGGAPGTETSSPWLCVACTEHNNRLNISDPKVYRVHGGPEQTSLFHCTLLL